MLEGSCIGPKEMGTRWRFSPGGRHWPIVRTWPTWEWPSPARTVLCHSLALQSQIDVRTAPVGRADRLSESTSSTGRFRRRPAWIPGCVAGRREEDGDHHPRPGRVSGSGATTRAPITGSPIADNQEHRQPRWTASWPSRRTLLVRSGSSACGRRPAGLRGPAEWGTSKETSPNGSLPSCRPGDSAASLSSSCRHQLHPQEP